MEEIKRFRLFQLCESIRRALESATGGRKFWVSAEVASVGIRNGHRYIELVDSEGNEPIARMQASLWQGEFQRLCRETGADLHAIIEAGKKVLLLCSVQFHPFYGLKLLVHGIDPNYTLGDMEQKKRETMLRLRREGLAGKNQKLNLPPVIKKIGIVSSSSASGLEDFEKHLEHNSMAYGFAIRLFETPVQGTTAEAQIIQSIASAQDFDVDVIVIIRGGGSRLDLEVFNAYGIGVAIANCRVAVFTGIGHESDDTVADLIAHTRYKTPTAVAHAILERNQEFHSRMQWGFERITKEARIALRREREYLAMGSERFRNLLGQRILRERHSLEIRKNQLADFVPRYFERQRRRREKLALQLAGLSGESLARLRLILRSRQQSVIHAAFSLISRETREYQQVSLRLKQLPNASLQKQRLVLQSAGSRINLVHPGNILRKGFAIVTLNGKAITKPEEVNIGDLVTNHFYHFQLISRVEKKE